MYYKLTLKDDGTLELLDVVDKRKADGFIYATEKEYKKLNPDYVQDYSKDLEL